MIPWFHGTAATAGQSAVDGAESVTRRVEFEVTFANRDLTWLGDPASPTASACVSPTARLLATDCCIISSVTNTKTVQRRHYREARIVDDGRSRNVLAFTAEREKRIGAIDKRGRFAPNEFYRDNHDQLPSWPRDGSQLHYDPAENAIYSEVDVPGPVAKESLDFLPLELLDNEGRRADGRFSIEYRPLAGKREADAGGVALVLQNGDATIDVARATLPRVIPRADLQLSSFDNAQGTYTLEADYRTMSVESYCQILWMRAG